MEKPPSRQSQSGQSRLKQSQFKLGEPVDNFSPPPIPDRGLSLSGAFVELIPLGADPLDADSLGADPLDADSLGADPLDADPLDNNSFGRQLYAANALDKRNDNWHYLLDDPFTREADYLAWLSTMEKKTDPFFFVIVNKKLGQAVGIASYLRIEAAAGSIEIGHINFSPLLQRTTAATEAIYLMIKWAFDAGYRRCEWKCDALNARSRRAAQRLGFSYEGVFRQALVYKGRNRDTAWFAIIDKEWPAINLCYAQYLKPANFDENDKPILSLSSLTKPRLHKSDNFDAS